MAKTDVRAELLAATKITPKAGEEEAALALRVATYVSDKVSEEDYGKLSSGATAWFEKAVAAIEAEKDFTLPPAMNGAASPKVAAPAKKSAAGKKKGAPAKKAAGKKEKAPKAKAPKEPRVSASGTALELICKKPSISLEELAEKVWAQKVDISETQLYAVYQNTRRVINALQAAGKL